MHINPRSRLHPVSAEVGADDGFAKVVVVPDRVPTAQFLERNIDRLRETLFLPGLRVSIPVLAGSLEQAIGLKPPRQYQARFLPVLEIEVPRIAGRAAYVLVDRSPVASGQSHREPADGNRQSVAPIGFLDFDALARACSTCTCAGIGATVDTQEHGYQQGFLDDPHDHTVVAGWR